MGWRGTVRSIGAAVRAAERDAIRRQKELERQEREYNKMLELEQAAHEVDVYQNYIDRLVSMHAECSNRISWESMRDSPEPREPKKRKVNEENAYRISSAYQPGLLDKLFKRVEKTQNDLQDKVDLAKAEDESIYRAACAKFEKDHKDWSDSRQFSERILNKEPEAYVDAIKEIDPFSEIGDLGSSVSFSFDRPEVIEASVKVHGKDVVPSESKSLLKSGRLCTKKLPKGKFYETYQDYVCSSTLRVAGELFALLPIDAVIVTAKDDLLNTKTGHIEEQAILSVAVPRATFERLNLNAIDPSDSMQNFVHRMNFKKTKGFVAVDPVKFSDVDLTQEGVENVDE